MSGGHVTEWSVFGLLGGGLALIAIAYFISKGLTDEQGQDAVVLVGQG